MTKEQERKAVFLPSDLYSQIEERARVTGFGSVAQYVISVLEQALKEEDEEVNKMRRALGLPE